MSKSSHTRHGLVIVRYGKRALVEDETGAHKQCFLRTKTNDVVAGDNVAWSESADTGVIESREKRISALSRPNAHGRPRPIAANIDLMLIVIAPKPSAHANLIDRYLVAAEYEGIEAALVLNKLDLLTPEDGTDALTTRYEKLGYPAIRTDQYSDPEASALHHLIGERTIVLVGQSGVGKSSLINRLIPDLNIRVSDLSAAIDKGKHTTTAAALYHLPNGGNLIDSPGVREFHLNHLPKDAITRGFREFHDHLGTCRFRNCNHKHEDGCALLTAVEAGNISTQRFKSYRKIVEASNGKS